MHTPSLLFPPLSQHNTQNTQHTTHQHINTHTATAHTTHTTQKQREEKKRSEREEKNRCKRREEEMKEKRVFSQHSIFLEPVLISQSANFDSGNFYQLPDSFLRIE